MSFWKPIRQAGQSLRWAMSLPHGPLTQHLASLHAILLHAGANEDAMRLAEHHLREIAVATAEQPSTRPGDRPGVGRSDIGWKAPAPHYPPTGTYPDAIQAHVAEQMKRNDDAIEAMCERMLTQDGTDYGVLVKEMNNGTVKVSLSPDVPFSQIHHTREGASE